MATATKARRTERPNQQVHTVISGRDAYIERIDEHRMYVWQAMGKFHTVQMTNDGKPNTEALPAWARRLVDKHASEIRPWFGFTNTRRQDVPWESYTRAEAPQRQAGGNDMAIGDTYETMSEEHLGQYATADDLFTFRAACRVARDRFGYTAIEATNYVWDNGDFYPRVVELLGNYPQPSGMFR